MAGGGCGRFARCGPILALAWTLGTTAAPESPPLVEVNKTEHVSVRLVQLDAIVREKEPLGRALTAADFELTVGGHPVTGFLFDRACGETPREAAASP